tara:strand:+ start:2313 stop:4139 length:1827 start_codon:yes stop_codon:yes gene_type:complete
MAQEKITIKFDAVGEKGLIAAVKQLDKQIRSLQNQSKKYNETSVAGVKNNRLLSNSFATIRSKLLLVNFAMAMGIKQLIGFTKQAAKIESMSRAFNTLSGGSMESSVAMEKLKIATDGTMNQFDLFQQANNAMILGVSKNSDEMAEMFDVAQRLGRALGRDTASSVESLITGIGRQSRLMLDNIGIIVKADQAYDDYAKKLRISTDQLTDAQKKQAFLQATMEAARSKVSQLGEETLSTQDSYDKLSASTFDATTSMGNFISTIFNLPSATQNTASAIDKLTEKLNLTAFAQGHLNEQTINAISNESMLTFAIKEVENEIRQLSQTVHRDYGESIEEAFGKRATSEQAEGMQSLQVELQLLQDRLQEINSATLKTGILNLFGEDIDSEMLETMDITRQGLADLVEEWSKLIVVQEGVKFSNEDTASSYMSLADAFKISAISQEQQTKAIVGSSVQTGIAYDNAGKAAEKAGQQVIQSLIQEAVMSLMADAVKKLGWFGVPLAATAGAVIGSLVGQAQRHIKFEDGGLVGGRRHSQGGTVIEAEQGEFVMRRDAVDAIGVESLNAMNQGGGGGAVTVNLSGNVMSQDFVEGELSEQIREAVRRGSDFGL